MPPIIIGNFGKRNSIQNGQSQKALQVYRLLKEQMNVHPEMVDSGDYLRYAFSFVQAVRGGQSVALCVGPKGIRLASLLFAAIGSTLRRKPSITLFVVGGWLPSLAARAGDVAGLCRASRVLVEAQGLRDELAALGIASELFPNFRDLPIQKRSKVYDPECVHLIYCGRISMAKGAGRALELLTRLREQLPQCRLDFYGPIEGAELNVLIDQTEGATYRGSFDEVSATARIFPDYDFLVLPSAYPGECVPGAVVEAMFSGLPSIVSDWRFLPEVVSHNRSGFVCDLEQFADQAARCIWTTTEDTFRAMSQACSDQASTKYSADNARRVLSIQPQISRACAQ